MSAALYLTVYAEDDLPLVEADIVGKSLGTVDACTQLDYTHALHGAGSITISIPRTHTQAALLVQNRYVLVHSAIGVIGGAFLEPAEIDLTSEDGTGGEFAKWTGRGQMAYLERGNMPTTSTQSGGVDPSDGRWPLWKQGLAIGATADSLGAMYRRAVLETHDASPSGIPDLTHDFTYLVDSDGTGWDTSGPVIDESIGNDLLQVTADFDRFGLFIQMEPLFLLHSYRSYGRDLTGAAFGTGVVRFEAGTNIAASIARKIQAAVKVTHLLVSGMDYSYQVVVDPDYTAGDPVRWGFLSAPETDDAATMTTLGLANIAARKRQSDVFSFPLHDHGDSEAAGIYEPGWPGMTGAHFWVGDSITMHTGSDTYDVADVTYPISAITWHLLTDDAATGDYSVIVEIGDNYSWSDGTQPGVNAGQTIGTNNGPTLRLCDRAVAGQEPTFVAGTAGAGLASGGAFGGQLTVAFTLPSGNANTIMYLFTTYNPPGGGGGADFTSVVWQPDGVNSGPNEQSLTLLDGVINPSSTVSGMVVYQLLNPIPSTNAGSRVALRGNSEAAVGVIVVRDADLSDPQGTIAKATGTGAASAVTAAPASGDLTINAGGWLGSGVTVVAPTAATGQTSVDTATHDGLPGTGDTAIGIGYGDSTPGWNFTNSYDWCAIAIPVHGSAASNPLNGTSNQAARCDKSEHEISSRAPTVDDDVDAGYPRRTLWHDTTSGKTWISTDSTAGAAVWELFSVTTAADLPFTPTGTNAATNVQDAIEVAASSAAGVPLTSFDQHDVLHGYNLTRQGLIISPAAGWKSSLVESPSVFWDPKIGKYRMIATGYNGTLESLGYWTSPDLETWTEYGSNPFFSRTNSAGDPDQNGVTGGYCWYEDGTYHLFYIGLTSTGYESGTKSICHATSTDFSTWTRHGAVISPSGSGWRQTAIWHPNIVKRGGTYYLFFNATGTVSAVSTERIGYATSTDLSTWTVDDVNSPLLTIGSGWESNKLGDPFVYRIGETWYMAYEGYDGTNAGDGLAFTSDADFPLGWTKYASNPVLPHGSSGYDSLWAGRPCIWVAPTRYYHWYSANDGSTRGIGLATEDISEQASSTGAQHILLADGHATPFTFSDLLQMDDGSDFMWSDPE